MPDAPDARPSEWAKATEPEPAKKCPYCRNASENLIEWDEKSRTYWCAVCSRSWPVEP